MIRAARKKGTASRDENSALVGSSDLAYGQYVIVTARWVLVAAGLVLALWLPGPIEQLRVSVIVLLGLAVANFYLHAQLLRRRPAIEVVAYAASAADVSVITLLIASQGGFTSDLYIFYFPALLALSLAFPTAMTLGFGAIVVAGYGLISASTATTDDQEIVVTRLIMLAAVAICGNMYWRIEGGRREAAVEAQQALVADIQGR